MTKKKTEPSNEQRRCIWCNCVLSRMNPDNLCRPCQLKELRCISCLQVMEYATKSRLCRKCKAAKKEKQA